MSLSALLERVEGATGPDREIDRELAVNLLGWCLHPPGRQRDDSAQSDTGYTCLDCGADSWGNTGPSGQRRHDSVPAPTASVDAALALIGRVRPGMEFHLSTARHRKGWSVKTWVSDDKYSGRLLDAPTPALALCAALLAAMIGEEAKPSPPSTVTP